MLVLKTAQSFIFILVILNFLTRMVVSVTIRSSDVPFSNELEQYYHYKNITNYTENFFNNINCAHINDQQDLKGCIIKEMEKVKQLSLFPPIWKSVIKEEVIVGKEKGMHQQVDCTYNVPSQNIKTNVKDTTFSVYFKIIQCNCNSKTKILGGASFYIVANSPNFLSTCGITDLFNNTYNVECHLPLNIEDKDSSVSIDTATNVKDGSMSHKSSSFYINETATKISSTNRRLERLFHCMNISVVMEHEHFDVRSNPNSNSY